MNGDERASLEILRAEVNGKLDVLVERTTHLVDTTKDHEVRLRHVEEAQQQEAGESALRRWLVPVLLTLTLVAIGLHTFFDVAAA